MLEWSRSEKIVSFSKPNKHITMQIHCCAETAFQEGKKNKRKKIHFN